DLVHFGFFASHLAATLLMDVPVLLTGIFEPSWASPLRSMLNQYLEISGDPLMSRAASSDVQVRDVEAGWFRAFLACEVGLQLPVFVYGGWRLWTDTVDEPTETVLTVYGVHAATTLVPVLHAIWTLPAAPGSSISRMQRAGLMALYLPYLIVPVHM
ncbi:transmembrane protein 6/97, partial [Catenaria anguillulae PL171]